MDKELELEAEQLYKKIVAGSRLNRAGNVVAELQRQAYIAGATTSSRVKNLENRVKELEDGLNKILGLPQTIGHAYIMQDIAKKLLTNKSK